MTEKLTRLNPKNNRYESTSGKSDETVEDLLVAISQADKAGIAVMMAKVCGDRSQMPPHYYQMYRKVAELWSKYGWKSPRGSERLRSMVNLAVFEMINDLRCPVCKGTNVDMHNPTKGCKACVGGNVPIFDAERASALNISTAAYSKTWGGRYERVRQYVYNYLGDRESRAKRQMRAILVRTD